MLTPLHEKIKSMCTITRKEDPHWILVGSKTIWASEIQEVVTTKRAAYAAFVGPIPDGDEVFSTCGTSACIRPEHMALRMSRAPARALSLPNALAELQAPKKYVPVVPEKILPKGLTVADVILARHMMKDGASLAQIRSKTGLSPGEAVKAANGAYDEAVRNSQSATRAAEAAREVRKKKMEGATEHAPVVQQVRESTPRDATKDSDDESAWLKQVMRG